MRYALDEFPVALALVQARRRTSNGEVTPASARRWSDSGPGCLPSPAVMMTPLWPPDESRRLGAPDDAVTQILWRATEGVVLARRGDAQQADRISAEGTEIADGTDSFDAGTAWLARAHVLSILGRPTEATQAARRARERYAAKGFVNGIRRAEALIVEPAPSA